MKIVIRAVGALKAGPEYNLFEDYRKKSSFQLEEMPARTRLPRDKMREKESEALLKGVSRDDRLVVLDRRGQSLSSEALARELAHEISGRLLFIIGGHEGFTDALFRRADLVLSFGQATWPWKLVRVMLAEQIYRAEAIQKGWPYHRSS